MSKTIRVCMAALCLASFVGCGSGGGSGALPTVPKGNPGPATETAPLEPIKEKGGKMLVPATEPGSGAAPAGRD